MEWDIQQVLRLAQSMVKETIPHKVFDRDKALAFLNKALVTGHPVIFVAEVQNDIHGALVASVNEYTFTSGLFVDQRVLYVRPDKRGTRAAANLIKEFLAWGQSIGAEEATFGVSNGFQPERTAKLFELFGAKRVGYNLRMRWGSLDGQE